MAAILPRLLFSVMAYLFLRKTRMRGQVIILLGTAALNITGAWLSVRIYTPHLLQQGKSSFAIPLPVIVFIALISGLLIQLAKTSYIKYFTKH